MVSRKISSHYYNKLLIAIILLDYWNRIQNKRLTRSKNKMQSSNDNEKLVTLLESTLNPTLRKQAEEELGGVSWDLS